MTTPVATSSPYNIHKLNDARDFRLLRVSNDPQTGLPLLYLKTDSLNNKPDYVAISYVWGPQEPSFPIDFGGSVCTVGGNLAALLKTLIDEGWQKWLYIDRLCIDQENLGERAQQVTLMGEIFRTAQSVLIWLGESNPVYKTAFEAIEFVCPKVQRYMLDHQETNTSVTPFEWPAYGDDEVKAIRYLFSAEWFSRVWTFQEVVLCRAAMLKCGKFQLRWAAIEAFLLGYQMHPPGPNNEDGFLRGKQKKALDIVKARRLVLGSSSTLDEPAPNRVLSLPVLLKQLHNHQASDPRDKVFALINVACDVSDGEIAPDYEQSHLEVYANTVKWMLKKHKSLAFLSMVEKKDKPDLVSWVPDFRSADVWNFLHQPDMLLLNARDRWWSASGASEAMQLDASTPLLYLPVRTIRVGKITGRSEPPGNLLGTTSLGAKILHGGEWHLFAQAAAPNGVYQPTGESIDLAFQRLRIWDVLPREGTRRRHRPRPLTLADFPQPGQIQYTGNIGDIIMGPRDDIGMSILAATSRKRMFTTESGYIGVGRRCLELGDEVHILMGFHTPCILRKLGRNFYTFGGEAYIHGLMDGELLLMEAGRLRPNHSINGISPEDMEWLDGLAGRDMSVVFPASKTLVIV